MRIFHFGSLLIVIVVTNPPSIHPSLCLTYIYNMDYIYVWKNGCTPPLQVLMHAPLFHLISPTLAEARHCLTDKKTKPGVVVLQDAGLMYNSGHFSLHGFAQHTALLLVPCSKF
ncbi:hypothetical protein F4825DRAFT_433836 [Nemania diffusa]|nr:hypothetical protein F4825DRAFT_433836 [Nemania diffusa]